MPTLLQRTFGWRIGSWMEDSFLIPTERLCLNFVLQLGKGQKPGTLSYDRALRFHQQYPWRDGYGYDVASKKKRAAERLEHLASLLDMDRVRDVAEVGGGDGQLSLLFCQKGFHVNLLDTEDWRDPEVKGSDIDFHLIDEGKGYVLPDNAIDLCLSYCTFEHVPDPAFTLQEMVRVTRPGGSIFLYVDPLYNCPWGLHAYNTFYGPYPQFLLDKGTLQRFADQNGIWDLGVEREDFQYVNQWSLSDYRRLIDSFADRVTVKLFLTGVDYGERWAVYRYLTCFWGRNLSFEELTTQSLEILLTVK